MTHELEIPDDLWKAYDGNPWKIRHTLEVEAVWQQMKAEAVLEARSGPTPGFLVALVPTATTDEGGDHERDHHDPA